jgi:hypothetical protein
MLNIPTKQCGVCEVIKPASEFYVTKNRGLTWSCKLCSNVLSAKYRLAHPGRNAEAVRRHKQRYPERVKKIDRKMHIKKQCKNMGITEDDLKKALTLQGGQCAVCQSVEVNLNGGYRIHMDHCHKTQRFRGILCQKCNVMLGMAEDNPERLIRAADYIKNHSGVM